MTIFLLVLWVIVAFSEPFEDPAEALPAGKTDPRFAASCVRDGAREPCLACDECRHFTPGSCD